MTNQEIYEAFYKLCEKEAEREYNCPCDKHIGMVACELVFRGQIFEEDEEVIV